jgi:hypothetical protein
MPLRNWAPVVYGGIFGMLAGGVGVAQVIIIVRDYEAQIVAFEHRFPPGYTGFRDATSLVRGGEWDFVGTAFEALGIIAILLTSAATLAVVATRKSRTGIVTTLIAGAMCAVIYLAASAIAISTGPHPLIHSNIGVLRSDVPGCFAVFGILLFALVWFTGRIGAGLGSLIAQRIPDSALSG